MMIRMILSVALSATISCKGAATKDDVRTVDTEPGSPMDAQEATKSLKMPVGFTATLFAAEPWVRQPIDMKTDSRGRVWVAEAYWYGTGSGTPQDRIVVLEDTDGDGRADKRAIFIDQLNRITSIEIGFGGVWVLAPPNLVFYPDADGDLKPDGPPETHVTGWNTHAQWNLANGLQFGPDGWLYGREGQLGTSSPSSVRRGPAGRLSAGIWRYHPPSGKVDIVCQGMTNPWGLDWNEDGELFASGNCNGHLWHIVGGSLMEWGFGAREFPSEYGRTPPIQEAPHYKPAKDWFTAWNQREEMAQVNSQYGGGHSHCGLVICNGSSWPETMRGHTLMLNLHGKRVNEDRLDAHGGTYISRRVGDPIMPRDPWFRGVSIVAATDGAFYISDWSDTGECHEKTGVDQNSARIFRILPTPAKAVPPMDAMDDATLFAALTEDREEPARQALRILQHRAQLKRLAAGTRDRLLELARHSKWQLRLRALSALHGGGILETDPLLAATQDADDRVRACAVRYWAETAAPEATMARILEMAANENSPRVLLHLASVTRQLPETLRLRLTAALIGRTSKPIDARAAQLLWHVQIQNPSFSSPQVRTLVADCKSPEFSGYLASYLVENDGSEGLNTILEIAAASESPAAILTAAIETARKTHGVLSPPRQWPQWRERWMNSPDKAVQAAALAAAVLFGDIDALDALKNRISDPAASIAEKTEALETLALAQTSESISIVAGAFRDKALRVPAIRAMRHFKQPAIADSLVSNWARFDQAERLAVVETLVGRKEWAMTLLDAIGPDGIKPEFLSATQARDLASNGDAALRAAVLQHWGDPDRSSAQKIASTVRVTAALAEKQPGDPIKGHELFSQRCGICHVLYGEGGKLGPDLTGRNRSDLPSILRSVIDPSAEVPEDGRLSIVTRKDGGIVSGFIVTRNASGIMLRNLDAVVLIRNEDIANLQTQTTSPMPEGLLDGISDEQIRDLFSYIQADQTTGKK